MEVLEGRGAHGVRIQFEGGSLPSRRPPGPGPSASPPCMGVSRGGRDNGLDDWWPSSEPLAGGPPQSPPSSSFLSLPTPSDLLLPPTPAAGAPHPGEWEVWPGAREGAGESSRRPCALRRELRRGLAASLPSPAQPRPSQPRSWSARPAAGSASARWAHRGKPGGWAGSQRTSRSRPGCC